MKHNSEKKPADIVIFTDGASSGNPGPGGWGAIVGVMAGKGTFTELGGGEARTTNNRMELAAAIGGLAHVADFLGDVVIYTDSKYVRDGITKWVPVWRERGWMTTAKKEVLNQDMWQKLAELVAARAGKGKITWRLVPGHEGLPANERADEIAVAFATGRSPQLFTGSLEKYSIDLAKFADTDFALPERTKKSSSKKSSAQKAYSYVSRVNKKIMTHASWEECFKRVNGVSGARFKKALSFEDEKRIIAEFQSL